jgi:hypothetical protein
MHPLRKKADLLRQEGYSYKIIEEKLGIARSTLSYWFKDQVFTPNQEVLIRLKAGPAKAGEQRHKARLKEIAEQLQQGSQEVGQLSARERWLVGIGIYIGEGAKTTETTRISNADPAVISLAVRWLLHSCNMQPENLSVRLHLYPDNNEEECLHYWEKVTGLSRKNFRSSSIDRRPGKQLTKVRRLPYGTAHVTVLSRGDPAKGRRFYRKLNGWMQAVLNQL